MPDTTTKPIIFLAFANDRDDTVGYLRNLPDEARRLREVLEKAERDGLCEVVMRSNSTAGDIFKVFQDSRYRNRIAIFHYGGHANGYHLLLESSEGQAVAADAGGLTAFLAQQQGLQLVFLNGCSTQQQTRGLLDANVSAVISTSRAIDDQVATDFARQFYQGLAGGATIRTAYNEAEAAVQMAKGGKTRALYYGGPDDSRSQQVDDRWPWNLHVREGSEKAARWNLPEAVNDPLFGLPPLPEQDLPESPYRHLNWFTRQDAEVFFGRGHQIRELYDRLTVPRTAPILLFYGQSGVGKSSILAAGLLPRLEQDHEIRYLRRTQAGLLDTLQLAFLPEASDVPIEKAWQAKEKQAGRPLIVFLDQVEEVYTRPIAKLPDELDQFLGVVNDTFGDANCRPRGKLVLGFRKEWLAELDSHLADHELPRTKVFLEPLDRRGVIEAVQGPAQSERLRERYGLTVENGLAETIANDLLEDRGSAIAPTLQILLTRMWGEATEEYYEHPKFNQELYFRLKRQGMLLRDFLNQQIAAVRGRYPEAVESGLLLDILALHTTPLGTADQCSDEKLREEYAHVSDSLRGILQQCKDLYLLTAVATAKKGAEATRLAHDTLAPLVRSQFDESDRPGQRARRILDAKLPDWVRGKKGASLGDADLRTVEDGVCGTRAWNQDERRLINASIVARKRRRQIGRLLRAAALVAIVLIAAAGGTAALVSWRLSVTITERDDTIKDRDTAIRKLDTTNDELDRSRIEVTRRLATEERSTAFNARDSERNPFKAAHLFARAADHFSLAKETSNARSMKIAAGHLLQTFPKLEIIYPTSDTILHAEFTPDDKYIILVTGDALHTDRTIQRWEVATGEVSQTLDFDGWRHSGLELDGWRSSGLEFSPIDELMLIVCNPPHEDQGAVTLWNWSTGEIVAKLQHEDVVSGARFCLGGHKVLSWGEKEYLGETGSIKLWDVSSDKQLKSLSHDAGIKQAFVSQDEEYVLSWSCRMTDDKTLWASQIWDIESETLLRTCKYDGHLQGAVFCHDGQQFLTFGQEGAVLRDVKSGETVHQYASRQRLLISGDRTRFVTWSYAAEDGKFYLWNVDTAEMQKTLDGQGDRKGVRFFEDSSRLITWSGKTTVVYDTNSEDRLHTFEHSHDVADVILSPSEDQLLTYHEDGITEVWNVPSGELLHRVQQNELRGAVFSHDEKHVLSYNSQGDLPIECSARLWNIDSPESARQFDHDDDDFDSPVLTQANDRVLVWSNNTAEVWDIASMSRLCCLAHEGKIQGVAFNGSETRVVTWGGEWDTHGYVRLWNGRTGEPLEHLEYEDEVKGAILTRDDKHVLAWGSGGERTATMRDIASGRVVRTFQHPTGSVGGAKFSTNGSRLLTWDSNSVRLWNSDDDEAPIEVYEVPIPRSPDNRVSCASFINDEMEILVRGEQAYLGYWRVNRNRPVVESLENLGGSAVFSPDLTRMLTKGHDDDNVELRDVKSGKRIQMIDFRDPLKGAVFGPTEKCLVWGLSKPQLWDVRTGKLRHTLDIDHIVGAAFDEDGGRLLAWAGNLEMWDIDTGRVLATYPLEFGVHGAQFFRRGEYIMAWGAKYVQGQNKGVVRLWKTMDEPLSLAKHRKDDDSLSHYVEVRMGTTVDAAGNLRPLSRKEWDAKRESLASPLAETSIP